MMITELMYHNFSSRSLARNFRVLLLCFIYHTLLHVQCARILLVAPSLQFSSHRNELLIIGNELAQRGHMVFITTASNKPDPDRIALWPKHANISEVQYYVTLDDVESLKQRQTDFFSKLEKMRYNWFEEQGEIMCDEASAALRDETFTARLKSLKFDYALVDRFFPGPCFMLIPHFINVPFFSTGSNLDIWQGGTPTIPSIYSIIVINMDPVSFLCRLKKTFLLSASAFIEYDPNLPFYKYNRLLETYASNISNWRQLILSYSLLFFVTREQAVDFVQPLMPNVIVVPALTFTNAKQLSPDFESIMTSSIAIERGVIVASFGSMVSHLPEKIIRTIMAAFSLVNYTIIWKTPNRDLNAAITIPSNVHAKSWLPQNDLLGHRNTKLFITHCGNNGQYEAIYHKVPMVAFPLYGDQDHNAYRLEKRKFGIRLDIASFTADDLIFAINQVISSANFYVNVAKVCLAKMFAIVIILQHAH